MIAFEWNLICVFFVMNINIDGKKIQKSSINPRLRIDKRIGVTVDVIEINKTR